MGRVRLSGLLQRRRRPEEQTGSFQIALITSAEAARRLSGSCERVRRLLEAHELEGLRVGGQKCSSSHVAPGLQGEAADRDRVLVAVRETAGRLGLSTVTIRAWVKHGRLESFQVEGDPRVYLDGGGSSHRA